MRLLMRVSLAALLLLGLSGEARGEVDAATRGAARDLGYAGVAAYQAGDYATASAKLEKAYAVLQAPSLGLWSGRALARLGKLVEASERYLEVTRLQVSSGETAVHEQAKKDARSEYDTLVPKIPKLIVRVTGVDPNEVSVTIDGIPMQSALIGESRPVNPGQHLVRGKRGDEVVDGRAALPQGGSETVELVFKGGPLLSPVAAADAAYGSEASTNSNQADAGKSGHGGGTLRTLGWISLVTGGVGLVAGGISGVIALDWKSQIENDADLDSDANEERYNTLRAISIGSLIGGGVLAATGVVILVTTPTGGGSARTNLGPFVGVDIGPSSVRVRGRF